MKKIKHGAVPAEAQSAAAVDAVAEDDKPVYEDNSSGLAKSYGKSLFNWFAGLAILFVFWWIGGYLIEINPDTTNFKDFGPIPTFQAYPELFAEGKIQAAIKSSGYRLGIGLFRHDDLSVQRYLILLNVAVRP